MRWRCAAGIFHRSAVFSRRTSALLHLGIRSPESDGPSESHLRNVENSQQKRQPSPIQTVIEVVLALATVFLVWLAYWQWDALDKTDQTNREINRAFVKGKELQISQDIPLYWSFVVEIENTGNTEAKNLEAFVNESFTLDEVNTPPSPARKTPLFAPKDPEDVYKQKRDDFPAFTRIPLGARAATFVARYGIPAQTIDAMANNRSDGYISGVVWYDDVFLRSDHHKSKFCFVVQPVKKGDTPTTVSYGLCQYWNCADDECDKHKREYDAEVASIAKKAGTALTPGMHGRNTP